MNELETINKTFNKRVVESLDVLNKVLAIIFVIAALLTFGAGMMENFGAALLGALGVMIMGLVTCGYTALLLNINNNLQTLVEHKSKELQ